MNEANPNRKPPSPFLGALVGLITGVAFGFFGFLMATVPATRFLGGALFFLVPISAGVAISLVMRGSGSLTAVTLLSTFFSLLALIAAGREGTLCAIMAFPLVFGVLSVGLLIGYGIRRLLGEGKAPTSATLLLLPVLIIGGHRLELRSDIRPRSLEIKSTVWLPSVPENVWPYVQSVDSIGGPKPLLMHLGLPVPQKCVLQGTAVGSKRVCYFNQGYIEETVLDWQPPKRMRFSIDRTNLPGRHWLGFEEAQYVLEPSAAGTLVTRTTRITSGLGPAWYWEPLERWGVSSEHHYLFHDLARRFREH